jgi:NCS1 family nucleobase:cation symporter-1
MEIRDPSPPLQRRPRARADEEVGAFSIFNVWTSDVHSLWGYYLAASLFLLCGSFVNFIVAIGIGSLIIFFLMNLIGYAGVKTGVPYPVLARASFGVWGANLPALVRAIVACFWYGAQNRGGVGRDRRPPDAHRRVHGVPQVDPLPRPLGPRSDLLRRSSGRCSS